MYWNSIVIWFFSSSLSINRNMRCIEMTISDSHSCFLPRLIETWDVLKWNHLRPSTAVFKINRNMRCIEITDSSGLRHWTKWLIETWDVLKSLNPAPGDNRITWLIETWDVLKLIFLQLGMRRLPINRNMRCIEITLADDIADNRSTINRNMRCIEIHQGQQSQT